MLAKRKIIMGLIRFRDQNVRNCTIKSNEIVWKFQIHIIKSNKILKIIEQITDCIPVVRILYI